MNLNINIPNILKFRTYFFNININLKRHDHTVPAIGQEVPTETSEA